MMTFDVNIFGENTLNKCLPYENISKFY